MDSITKIHVCWNLWNEDIKPNTIAQRLFVHRATIFRWISWFNRAGLKRTIAHYKTCKKGKRHRTDGQAKRYIRQIRDRYHDCCGQKIRFYLKQEYGISLSVPTIYRILRETKILRKRYRTVKYGEVPKSTSPREVVQTDTVDFGDLYAFTYVDIYTRQAYVELQSSLESENGKVTFENALRIFGRMGLIQSDGGPEFKDKFVEAVKLYGIKHRVSRPYKKNEQSYIESFNRTLRKECLGWGSYTMDDLPLAQEKVAKFLDFYNNYRPHLGLDLQIPNNVATCRI